MTDTHTAPLRALRPETAERLGRAFTDSAQWAVWDAWKDAAFWYHHPEYLSVDGEPVPSIFEDSPAAHELEARSGPVCALLEAITCEQIRWTDDTMGGGGLEVVAEHTGGGWRIWDRLDSESWAVELADLCHRIEQARERITAWTEPEPSHFADDEEPF